MVKSKVQTWLSRVPLAFHTDFVGALIIQQDMNEGSALHWGPASCCGPGGHCSPALLPNPFTRAGERHSWTGLQDPEVPSHLVFLCLHLLISRGEGDIIDAAADNGNRGDGCQIIPELSNRI